jgi:putative hydrolase of the HAD superfamily
MDINSSAGCEIFYFDADSPISSIFFDLDDTLIHCQNKYDSSQRDCLDILQDEFGFDDDERQLLYLSFKKIEINNMKLKSKNFDVQRYDRSWQETYESYAAKLGIPVDGRLTELLAIASRRAWTPPFRLYEDVEETLLELRRRFPAVSLNILTLGDSSIQMEKIAAIPDYLRAIFDSIVVVPDKTASEMRKIFGEHPEQVLMVGNSEKSDIEPALRAGAKTILIPNNTWFFMRGTIKDGTKNFRRVATFSNILTS